METQEVTQSASGSVYKGGQPNGKHCIEFVFDHLVKMFQLYYDALYLQISLSKPAEASI